MAFREKTDCGFALASCRALRVLARGPREALRQQIFEAQLLAHFTLIRSVNLPEAYLKKYALTPGSKSLAAPPSDGWVADGKRLRGGSTARRMEKKCLTDQSFHGLGAKRLATK